MKIHGFRLVFLILAGVLSSCAAVDTLSSLPAPAQAPTLAQVRAVEAGEGAVAVQVTPDLLAQNWNTGDTHTYTVVKGDTLWDIASRFLRDPWLWPEIWYVNPEIQNPHLIYPGDTVMLTWVDGKPRLRWGGDKRLSPAMRKINDGDALPTIPLAAVRGFLQRSRFLSAADVENSAYVLAGRDGRSIYGEPMTVYARGGALAAAQKVQVVEIGKAYTVGGNVLGFEAIPVGTAEVLKAGDPAELTMVNSLREARAGNRLVPMPVDDLPSNLVPKAFPLPVQANVIHLFDGATIVGRYSVVTINVGAEHGVRAGHVFSIKAPQRRVEDTVTGEIIALPQDGIADAIVFRTRGRFAHALVLRAKQEVRQGYVITNP